MGSIRIGVGVDIAGGDLSSAAVDHNAFAEFVSRDTIPCGTEIKNLDIEISIRRDIAVV